MFREHNKKENIKKSGLNQCWPIIEKHIVMNMVMNNSHLVVIDCFLNGKEPTCLVGSIQRMNKTLMNSVLNFQYLITYKDDWNFIK